MTEISTATKPASSRINKMLAKLEGLTGRHPDYQLMLSANLIPHHQAIDSAPYLVRGNGHRANDLMIKLVVRDGTPQAPFHQIIESCLQASDLGISPGMIAWESAEEGILYELLAPEYWRCAKQKDFYKEEILAGTIELKKRFHESKALSVTESPFDHIRSSIRTLAHIRKEASVGLHTWEEPEHFSTLIAYINEIEMAMTAAGFETCPTHGEHALSNIMLGPDGQIKLLDFDRAVNADPLSDLAGLILEALSLDWRVEQVIEIYCGSYSERIFNRVKLYMITEDFKWGCWSLVCHYLSERKNSIEFYKSALNRFIRCRYWLSRWNIADLMKNI